MTYTDKIEDITAAQLHGFFVGWRKPLTPEKHLELLRGSTRFIAAVENDNVIGFITALSDGVNSAFIPLLEVLPEYQNRGIGTELTRRMLEKLGGISNIDLTCDLETQRFYAKFGMLKSHGMVIRK